MLTTLRQIVEKISGEKDLSKALQLVAAKTREALGM